MVMFTAGQVQRMRAALDAPFHHRNLIMKIDEEKLLGNWIHSHEEDTRGEMVFRPSTYSFPLSRGRRSLELAPGGKLTEGGPGPTDRTQQAQGNWSLAGDRLTVATPGASPQTYVVTHADRGKLVLRDPGPPS